MTPCFVDNISAVLAVNSKVELLKKFYDRFRKNHPNIPLVVSALQAEESVVKYLKELKAVDSKLTCVFGDPVDGHKVSFSENYNAAINAVQTENLVLVHTDMYFDKYFFDSLALGIRPKEFEVYTTMEPPIYIGHRRPGKIIGGFGTNFDNFQEESFLKYCEKYRNNFSGKALSTAGYGFFLAGRKEDFESVGGFDQETFNPVFCEDDDFMVRLRIKGYHAYLNELAICYHFVSQTIRTTAGDSMTDGEFKANRAFGKKWGFEARYIWITGYEGTPGALEVFDRKVSLNVGVRKELEDPLSPLFDHIESEHDSYDWDVRVSLRPEFTENSVTELFYKLGGIRLCPKSLKAGIYTICNGTVDLEIKERDSIPLRQDNRNYLFLQRQIKYEQHY